MLDVKDTDFFELEEEDFDTVLATDIHFSGKITFAKPFMIKGTVSGSIAATSDLVVDEGSICEADISANRILVKGTVKGNITATRLVFVSSSGSVTGDITAPQVVLEPGSKYTGKCTMTEVVEH